VSAATSVIALLALLAGSGETVAPRPLFVPRDDLAALVERAGRGLSMPHADLRELVRKGRETALAGRRLSSGEAGAALLEWRVEAVLDADPRLRVFALGTLRVLRPGVVSLPFPARNAALVSLEIDGETAATGVLEDGTPVLLARGPGDHALRAEWVSPVLRQTSGLDWTSFSLPRAASGTLRARLAGASDLVVRSGLRNARVEGGAVAGALDGTDVVIGFRAEGSAAPRPYVAADVAVLARIAPSLVEGTARFAVRSTAPLGERVRVRLPADAAVVSVTGPAAKAFSAAPGTGGDGSTVDVAVELLDPSLLSAEFEIRFERPAAADAAEGGWIAFPSPELPDAADARAEVRVSADARRIVAARFGDGVRRLPLADGDAEAVAAPALPFRIEFRLEDAPSESAARTSTVVRIEPGRMALETVAALRAGSAPLAEVAGLVPDGFVLESATAEGGGGTSPQRPVSAVVEPGEGGFARLVFKLDPPSPPSSETILKARVVRPERALPETVVAAPFRPEGFARTEALIGVAVSPRRRAVDAPGPALKKAPADSVAVIAEGRDPIRLAWRASGAADLAGERLEIAVSEPEPRVEATLTMIVAPSEEKLAVTAGLRFDVVEGAADRFRVELPAGFTEHVDVTPAPGLTVKETFRARETTGERDVFTIAIGERRSGPVDLSLRFERTILPAERSVPVAAPDARVLGVARERIFVGVESAPEIEVAASGEGLEPLDLALFPEVAGVRPARPLLHAYLAPRGDHALRLAIRSRSPIAVPAVVAESAVAECVVGWDGVERTRLALVVRNSGAEFLSVTFPPGARCLTASVGGEVVKPLAALDGRATLVPLPVTGDAASGVAVEVISERKGPPLRANGRVAIELPRTDALVLASDLRLFLPEGIRPYSIGGTFSAEWREGASDRLLVESLADLLMSGIASRYVAQEGAASAPGRMAPPAAAPAEQMPAAADDMILGEKESKADDLKANVEGATRRSFARDQSIGVAGKKGALPLLLSLSPVGAPRPLAGLGLGRAEILYVSERTERGLVLLLAASGFLAPFALRRRQFPVLATVAAIVVAASVLPALLPPLATRYLNGVAGGALAALALCLALALLRFVSRIASFAGRRRFRRRRAGAAAGAGAAAVLLATAVLAASAAEGEDEARPGFPPLLENSYFVPYDPDISAVPDPSAIGDGELVFVPHELYLRLWRRAHPDSPLERGGEPGGALVARARLAGEVEKDAVVFSARLSIVKLDKKWETIVLPFRGATLRQATFAGRPAPLRPVEEGFALDLESAGAADLDLAFVVPLAAADAGGLRALVLGLPPCPATRAVFSLPEGIVVARADAAAGGLAETRPAGTPTVTIDLGAARTLSVAFRDLRGAAGLAAAFDASIATRFGVGLRHASTLTDVEIRVLAGAVRDARIAVDAGIRVLGVAADGLRDPRVRETATGTVIDLRFEPPLTGTRTVRVTGAAAVEGGVLALPGLVLEGAARSAAFAVIASGDGVRVRPESAEGLERVNPEDVRPAGVSRRPADAAYRRLSPSGAAGRFSVAPVVARVDCEVAETVEIGRARVVTTAEIVLRPVEGPVLEAVVTFPADHEISQLSVEPAGILASRSESSDGAERRVALRFRAPLGEAARVRAVLEAPEAPATMPVPIAGATSARRTTGTIAIRTLHPLRVTELEARGVRSIAAPEGARLAYALASGAGGDNGPRIVLGVEPVPPRVQAVSFTRLTVGDESVAVSSHVLFRIEEGETELFRVAITGETEGPIDVAAGDRRRVSIEPETGPARVVTLETERPKRGTFALRIDFEVPRAADGVYRMPDVRALDALPAAALAAFASASRGEIEARPGAGAAPVPGETARRRLAGLPEIPRDAAIFEIEEGAALEARHVEFAVEGTLEASISEVSLSTVLADEDASGRGLVLTRARFSIQNRREQFLVLGLPEGAEILGALVDEAAVRPVSGAPENPGDVLLPLRKTSPGDTSFTAEIVWAERLAEPLRGLGTFRPGTVAVRNMPVQRTYWTIRVGRGLAVSVDGNMAEIPEAVERTERVERLLSEQEVLLGYLSSDSRTLRARALENWGRNDFLIQNELEEAVLKQEEGLAQAKKGLVEERQAVQLRSNVRKIESLRDRLSQLGEQAQSEIAQMDEILDKASLSEDASRTDEKAKAQTLAAELEHQAGYPAKRADEPVAEPAPAGADGAIGGRRGGGGRARSRREAGDGAERRAGESAFETFEEVAGLPPVTITGLKTIAIPFPERGPSRTWKKLESGARLEVRLARAGESRPVLALALVLAAAAGLALARALSLRRAARPSAARGRDTRRLPR